MRRQQTSKWLIGVLCLVGLVSGSQQASAGVISWTDWTSAFPGSPGSATGTLLLPGGSATVTYSGELVFAQTGAAPNYWGVPFNTAYLSSTVSNAPPASDILAIYLGGILNTLTFSAPVTDPIMALISVGQPGYPVSYAFSAPFDVLSSGPSWWGPGTLVENPGNILVGTEGSGAIQFSGTYTSISWVNTPSEYWHGFQVGAEPVPEPGTMLLLGSGLAGLALRRRRNNS